MFYRKHLRDKNLKLFNSVFLYNFFLKKKIITKNYKSKQKLSPHKSYKKKYLNINYSHSNLYNFNYINYSKIDLFINYNTLKLYIYILNGFGEVMLKPFVINNKLFTLKKKKNFSMLYNLILNKSNYFNFVGKKISNIFYKNSILVSSSGTHSVVFSQKKKSLKVILPSFDKKRFNNGLFFNGKNVHIKYIYINLSFLKSKKTKIVVRGIAKNPVDHPNGGNSNTKGSFKTPWGRTAKKNK